MFSFYSRMTRRGRNLPSKYRDAGQIGAAEVKIAKAETCLGKILDGRINRGILEQHDTVANGAKVYRNFLP